MKPESYLKFPFPPGYAEDINKRFNALPSEQQKNLIDHAAKIVDNFYGDKKMKEIIALADFRLEKNMAEAEISKIINDFANKYHCELKIDVDVVKANAIAVAVAESFAYQAYLSATF